MPRPLIFRGELPDSFERFHDLVAVSGAASSRIGDAFEATVTAYRLPELMLFDRQVVGVEHRRAPDHIRRDGFDHFYLQVLRSGLLAGGPPGEERTFAPGDAVLLDATRPQRTLVTAADYVTVVLPRSLVEAAVPDARGLHGRILPRAASRGLGDAVLSLARRVAALDPEAVSGAGGMVAHLLAETAGAAGTASGLPGEAGSGSPGRLRAGLFIDAHIGQPGLGVDAVAAGVGMSRSALYRAFEPLGGVEREIGRRRVALFRSALFRADEAPSMERLALRLGFSSFSHCSRVFKDTYGLSPSEYRAALRGMRGPAGTGLKLDHMRAWYGKLGGGG